MLRLHDDSHPFLLEGSFDLSALDPLRERLVEVDAALLATPAEVRRCVDLLARHLLQHGRDYVVTAVALTAPAMPWALEPWAPDDLRVSPRWPVEWTAGPAALEDLRRLKAWLERGAWICGDVGWSRELGCAQVPLLLPLSRMRCRPARAWIARAA